MSEPETPNAKRATPLHFDSDRVFAKQPFSDDEAVEIITDAAVEALAAHFDRPLPQSNIGEAIAIVRVHVDYLRGVLNPVLNQCWKCLYKTAGAQQRHGWRVRILMKTTRCANDHPVRWLRRTCQPHAAAAFSPSWFSYYASVKPFVHPIVHQDNR